MAKYKQHGYMGTEADKLIQDTCDWMDTNIGSDDKVNIIITVYKKDKATAELRIINGTGNAFNQIKR